MAIEFRRNKGLQRTSIESGVFGDRSEGHRFQVLRQQGPILAKVAIMTNLRESTGNTQLRLFRIQFPFALPALFAALRATAPLAITGAMLAEFFLVGNGLGHSINVARNEFDYTSMWAQAAIATLAAVVIYAISVGIEGSVLARFAPDRAAAAKAKA